VRGNGAGFKALEALLACVGCDFFVDCEAEFAKVCFNSVSCNCFGYDENRSALIHEHILFLYA
jgi:hypothetical protein